MGVDIQTYRARIGTYSHSQGSDVKTIPNICGEFKTVGCVIFIGILLIVAGIELNPGPKEKGTANYITCAKSSCIKISRLKENFNKELLKSFFEKYLENGGGKVKHIELDSKIQSAVIEFEDNSAVKRILDNKPLIINGLEVEVEIIVEKVNDNIGAQIDYAYAAQGDETTDQQFAYDDEHTKLLSAVAEASESDNKCSQIGNDGESLGDETIDQLCGSDYEYVNESETAGETSQNERKTTEGGVRKRLASFFSSAKRLVSESVTSKVTRKNPAKNNTKESDSSRQAASTETGGDEFYQLLQRLELTATFPGKISLRDVIAIDFDESNVLKNSTINLPDIPWLLLKRLMCVHSESRDITVSESDEHALDLEHSLSFCSEVPGENQNISPLDIFTVVFQCCDPVLKQVIVQKLYLCKLAVPFLYQHWENNTKQSPTLSIWPLRFLVIENKQTPTNIHQKQDRECDVLELPTKVLAFGRLGHSRFSKSKLINSFLLSQGCNTFFNRDCPSGMFSRHISNGQIEMFWLPTIDKSKDIFNHAMTFLNLRGDLGKHFSPDILYFIANFIDSIVMVVELDIVLNQSKIVEDVLLQFSSVILIIPDHLNKDAVNLVKSFHSGVILLKPNISLRILSTHIRTVEQNVVDMLSRITKNILDLLEKNKTMSLEERLSQAKLATIKTDEEDDVCQQGKIEASKLMEQMKAEGEASGWKQHLTPVHSNFSKQLGKLLKERERERDFVEGGNIDVKIMTVRRQQIKSITKYVKSFIHVLIKNRDHPLILNYFLCWLHFQIEREKRQILPCLVHAIRIAWEKLKSLKCAEEKVKDEIIEKQETVISDLEEQLDKESFTIQHFFREIGHINEAILELKEDTTKLGLPTLHHMSNIVSRLVVDGHHFELIDGESFYMTYQWNKAVLNNVNSCIESSKVMTLGVLGLQSSGKSTLLNTMFGSRFPSRTGRCTRGIHVQLIPIKSTNLVETTLSFSYVLIVDTEGLRSPQLSHLHHEHDNELATIITGLGDITMLNIMGENTSEIRDVLQVIVHAFLRLKMTNEKLDIRKCCAFIHQNVPDTSASEKMIGGLSKLLQTLDKMTKESARSEGILDITTFNQVIEFDINSQVWYLKNLWQGNPPMARVNNEYSGSVVDIKYKILKKALSMKDKSYKTLTDMIEQAHDLWKGVLNEDFVFSFKNSLEIKAYMQMECVVQAELWRLESIIRDKLIQESQINFATCDQKDDLRNVSHKLTSWLHDLLSSEKIKTEENIQTYFDGNKYKDIIIQWKSTQTIRVNLLFEKLQQIINEHVEKSQVKRSLEIQTVACQGNHEEELRERSLAVANDHKGNNLSNEKINQLFDDIWKEFLHQLDTSSTSMEKHRRSMRNIFTTCLENLLKNNNALLKQALKESNYLTPLSNVKKLASSFSETGINETDISFAMIQRREALFGFSDTLKYVGTRVNQIFKSVDVKIKELCQINDEVTEMSVKKLMHELDSSVRAILSGDCQYTFKVPFYVKVYVHVSRHVHPIFESHNEKYFESYGTAALLAKYRAQLKISFESHLRCRLFEDLVAELFSNIIESFAEEWTLQSLPNNVTDSLHSLLPKVKNRVIIEICTDLLEEGDFDNFVNYIVDPHEYATLWITKKANQYLDESEFNVLESTSSSLLQKLYISVRKCVNDVKKKFERTSPPSMQTWIESFQNSMTSSDFRIPSESFRNIKKEASSGIHGKQNVEHFTTKILQHLEGSEKKLKFKFKSQKSHTITWVGFNPISRIIKKIWGCTEKCVFCGEPCAKDQAHDGSTHYCIQHRPSCCRGVRDRYSKIACLESCEFDVQSNTTHTCSVFNYICNNEKRKECGKTHFYKDFKTYLPNWDIAPTSNMHDSSKYWMWFVVTYKEDLKKLYNYKIKGIPSTWNSITKLEAKESLHKIYSA